MATIINFSDRHDKVVSQSMQQRVAIIRSILSHVFEELLEEQEVALMCEDEGNYEHLCNRLFLVETLLANVLYEMEHNVVVTEIEDFSEKMLEWLDTEESIQ